jgi:hypothetical protein
MSIPGNFADGLKAVPFKAGLDQSVHNAEGRGEGHSFEFLIPP